MFTVEVCFRDDVCVNRLGLTANLMKVADRCFSQANWERMTLIIFESFDVLDMFVDIWAGRSLLRPVGSGASHAVSSAELCSASGRSSFRFVVKILAEPACSVDTELAWDVGRNCQEHGDQSSFVCTCLRYTRAARLAQLSKLEVWR